MITLFPSQRGFKATASVHVSLDLLDWIENRTAGSKQAAINTLLRLGIEQVEEKYEKTGEAVVAKVT